MLADIDVSTSDAVQSAEVVGGGEVQPGARTGQSVGYTQVVFQIAGCPAMTVRLRWIDDGLPIGCYSGAPSADRGPVGVAYQLEAAPPWRDRRPPLRVEAAV